MKSPDQHIVDSPKSLTTGRPGTPERFAFGANWTRFLGTLTPAKEAEAQAALSSLLGMSSLSGKQFLDIGSGSGLHSLSALRLGARVRSFDYDAASVGCTQDLYRRSLAMPSEWTVEQGSVLDPEFMERLGQYDVVYSWGVLHHTGAMWLAIEAAARRVAPGGVLAIALYNDQGWFSRYWTMVKRFYNQGAVGRTGMVALHLPYLAARIVVRAVSGRLKLERGMSLWHDLIDWLGGFPFEVASPQAVDSFLSRRGFALERKRTVGSRHGCNEFAYRRVA